MINKVLLFGGSGYVGGVFDQLLQQKNAVVVRGPKHTALVDESTVYQAIKQHNPTVVINAGGFTGKPNVDACETQKEQCYMGNVTLPVWMAKACDRLDVPFAQVSSGCIYNGHDKAYKESDAPDFSFVQNNCSYYSGTKAEAEAQLSKFPEVYIWRLRIPFDHLNSPRNFLTKLLSYPTILSLQNSVSHRFEFVEACLKTLELHIPYGVYNITNPGSIDAKAVLDMFARIRPATKSIVESKTYFDGMDQFMIKAKAPRSNCVLDQSKLSSFGITLRPVEQAMEETIEIYQL